MKVGFYIGDLSPSDGGVFTLESALLQALSAHQTGHQIVVFSVKDYSAAPHSAVNIVKIPAHRQSLREKLRVMRNRENMVDGLSLSRLAREHELDLMWFFNGFVQVDVPYVMTVQDLQHRRQPYFPEVNTYGWKWHQREQLYGTNVRRAAYVISGSEEGKRDIEFFYQIPAERIHVLKLPTPDDALQCERSTLDPLLAAKIQTPYLFYPAQFWSHKNHVTLLLALKRLEDRFPGRYSLVLTGSDKGNLNYIERMIAELGLTNRVHLLGVVDRRTLLALYQNAFALVFPTLFGPDNLPPFEAFALGCPVIAGDLPGCRSYLGEGALLVDPTDEQAIADAVCRIDSDPDLKSALLQHGEALAKHQTTARYLQQLFTIIDGYAPIRRCWGKM